MTGVHVAVLDTGVTVDHPHLRHLTIDGFGVSADGSCLLEGFTDPVGHGTAVAAAVFRDQPPGRLTAARVLDHRLTGDHRAVVRAMTEALERGARVINLSLGTTSADAGRALAGAVTDARAAGAFVVAAVPPGGRGWPADLPDVLSAVGDPSCPPGRCDRLQAFARLPGGGECALLRFRTHGRAIPPGGRAARGNLAGNSLAAAHLASRVVAALAEDPARQLDELVAWLERPGYDRSRGEGR